MSNDMLTKTWSKINSEKNRHDEAVILFDKLHALLEVALSSELKVHSEAVLHNYFWVVGDLLMELEFVAT